MSGGGVSGGYRKDLRMVLFRLPSQLTYSAASRSLSPFVRSLKQFIDYFEQGSYGRRPLAHQAFLCE